MTRSKTRLWAAAKVLVLVAPLGGAHAQPTPEVGPSFGRLNPKPLQETTRVSLVEVKDSLTVRQTINHQPEVKTNRSQTEATAAAW